MTACLSPVQWPIEQTSAAGEFCAVGGLAQGLEAGQCVEVWAGYKAMVGEFAKGKRALLDREFRCGGIVRQAARQPGYEGGQVPGHGNARGMCHTVCK